LFNLDQEARRALFKTRKLPPLPQEFPDSTLTVHLIFQYQR
jgi:outer membrane biosynthesis protein TonB